MMKNPVAGVAGRPAGRRRVRDFRRPHRLPGATITKIISNSSSSSTTTTTNNNDDDDNNNNHK